jgi:hypothetical protein
MRREGHKRARLFRCDGATECTIYLYFFSPDGDNEGIARAIGWNILKVSRLPSGDISKK